MMKYLAYMQYELIVPFQFHLKSSIHMISQKTLRWGFSFKQEWLSWKKKLLKNYFHLKYNKNYVEGFHIKIHLHVYQNIK
jgi:hypothetical protein